MSCPYGLPLGPRGFQRPKEPSVVAGDGSHHDDVGMDQIPVAGHLTGPVDVHLHHSPPLPGTDPQHGQCNKGRLIALGDPAFRNSEGQGHRTRRRGLAQRSYHTDHAGSPRQRPTIGRGRTVNARSRHHQKPESPFGPPRRGAEPGQISSPELLAKQSHHENALKETNREARTRASSKNLSEIPPR